MKYKITVVTGSLRGAGTDASISIKLTGMLETLATIQFNSLNLRAGNTFGILLTIFQLTRRRY